jgi:hypothetical protein
MNGSDASNTDPLFERALASEDEAYRLAEERLRDVADTAALQRQLSHPDPVGRLMAAVLLESTEAAGDDFRKATEYLERAERRFSETVAGTPPVRGIVDNLSRTFEGRLANFLALRLVKESEPPPWRALVTLAYLERHPSPTANDAIIRFAARTEAPELQEVSAQVLAKSGDPDLAQKLAAERERLARAGGALPPALATLPSAPGAVA